MTPEPGDLIEFEYHLPSLNGKKSRRRGIVRDVSSGVITAKVQIAGRAVVYKLDDAADEEDEEVTKRLLGEHGHVATFGPLVSYEVVG